MSDNEDPDAKAPRQFPAVPRLSINHITMLPYVGCNGVVIHGMWIKPGGETITTTELEFIAAKNGWNITIQFKE